MSEPSWVQVTIEVLADEVDAVSDQLWTAGVAGIEERPLIEADTDGDAEAEGGSRGDGPRVVLVAGLEMGSLAGVVAVLDQGGRPHAVTVVAADAGLDGWRDHATPTTVGALTIVPSWLDSDSDSDSDAPGSGPGGLASPSIIRLDAGRSFGHGGHVTTRLALGALQRVDLRGSEILDVGCGSGVLALAAARLGADRVVAVDTAAEAVDASRANVAVNDLGDVVEVRRGSVAGELGTFDVVLANIEAPILRALATDLAAAVREPGVLVLSGFIEAQEDSVLAGLASAETLERTVEDGWVALVLRPAGSSNG